MKDTIYREDAIDAILDLSADHRVSWKDAVIDTLDELPSAEPERDIPMQPNETIDSSWGIRKKQATCPKCDYYLNRIYFLGDSKKKKITYCETCGQAIDWEGWEWEE